MATIVTLPQIGISEESAVLAKWHIKAGDRVKPGDVLFSLETGKAAFDVESEAEGTVLALLVEEGQERLIKTPVCVLGEPGERYDLPAEAAPQPPDFPPAGAPGAEAGSPRAEAPNAPARGSGGVSPRARGLAEKAGVDPLLAAPSGPEGRIIERDVRALISTGPAVAAASAEAAEVSGTGSSPAGAGYTDIPHSTIRKVISANMQASLSELAQLTHHHSFDATAILALRKRCKASEDPALTGITLGDMVLYAVSRTLPDHPDLNAHYYDTHLRRFERVGLGIAVDTERGLIVPTIPDADLKSVRELSAQSKALAKAAREGMADASATATFTVTNLGSLGVELFTPVINPPQTGILGVCGITYRLREDGSAYPAMGLSLTYDHRAVDGAPASRFVRDLCTRLERFDLLLL